MSFPSNLYEDLEKIAEAKKVSVAWVIRDAAERYIAAESSPDSEERRR